MLLFTPELYSFSVLHPSTFKFAYCTSQLLFCAYITPQLSKITYCTSQLLFYAYVTHGTIDQNDKV